MNASPLPRLFSMTSRPPVASPGGSGSDALALHPPSIDLSNRLLTSAIPLPPNAAIAYAVFSPSTTPAVHLDTVELSRRRILDTKKPFLLDSLLCTVHIEKGGQQLFVFKVFSSDGAHDTYNSLNNLQFDGLICEFSVFIIQSPCTTPFVPFPLDICSDGADFIDHPASHISSFHPTEIHKSNPETSTRNQSSTPQDSSSTPQQTEHSSPSFPTENVLIPYNLFLKAVQERLINDICSVQDHDRILCRLNAGFLIFPQHPTSGWGTGWEHHAQNRRVYIA